MSAGTKGAPCGAPVSIRLRFRFVEGGSETHHYKTLEGARRKAQKQIGRTPTLGSYYAVDDFGCCTLTVDGCKLADLFPEAQA